jgi:hypothetical protein
LMDIENKGSGNVLVNGTIDNPIGTTIIRNTGGSIRSTHGRDVSGNDVDAAGGDDVNVDNRVSLVRTNILDLEAAGDIGGTGPRVNVDYVYSAVAPQPVSFKAAVVVGDPVNTIFTGPTPLANGQIVKYTTTGTPIGGLTNGAYYAAIVSGPTVQLALPTAGTLVPLALDPSVTEPGTIHNLTPNQTFTAIAGGDIRLDIKSRQRDPNAGPYTDSNPFLVVIGDVRAGGNADLLLQSWSRPSRAAGATRAPTSSMSSSSRTAHRPSRPSKAPSPRSTRRRCPAPTTSGCGTARTSRPCRASWRAATSS